VKKILKIEEIAKKGFLSQTDYKLTLLNKNPQNISSSEKLLLDKIFSGKNEIELSSLKNQFYTEIPAIAKSVTEPLVEKDIIVKYSRFLQIIFFIVAGVLLMPAIFGFIFNAFLGLSLLLSCLIWFIFAFVVRRRTKEGWEMLKRVKGFRLYMETAEKYRQRFFEKENIFETFLPYAMVFGITKLWIEKMKIIYGQDYFDHYHPVWYAGIAMTSFNADSFNSAMTSLSSNMSSTISSSPSSSGAGGGGFSGGGGGGGGGGGW
jgi:uncharacterized membrane protein